MLPRALTLLRFQDSSLQLPGPLGLRPAAWQVPVFPGAAAGKAQRFMQEIFINV